MAFLIPLVVEFAVSEALSLAIATLFPPKAQHGQKLKDKQVQSEAYDNPWPRCLGKVELPGQIITASRIFETIRKLVSGLFGSNSLYYYTYSVTVVVGFGKKLGGGPAVSFERVWASGKAIFTAPQAGDLISQNVAVAAARQGDGTITLTTDATGSITIHAGDLFSLSDHPRIEYAAQNDLTLGHNQSGVLSFYPTLLFDVGNPDNPNVPTGISLNIPGANGELTIDNTCFDPDPHDGSHPDSLFPGQGGFNFHLGSDDQDQDPTIVNGPSSTWVGLGIGNVPAYRGLAYFVCFDLELANFGNGLPAFSAEIDWGGGAASDSTVNISIPGTTGPWDVTSAINQDFDYGAISGGSSIHDWTPPVVYPKVFSPGEVLTLSHPSGLVNPAGGVLPPLGYTPVFPAWTYVGGLPFFNPEQSAGTLCGAWTDLNGRVIQPVWIAGNGFIKAPGGGDGSTCPFGASLFQFGINDDIYSDNTGALIVTGPASSLGPLTLANIVDAIHRDFARQAGYDSPAYDVSDLTPITHIGIELSQETFAESIQKLMQVDLFDAAETDAKIVYKRRGHEPVTIIPADDLGALAETGKQEPRLTEKLTQENDVPESFWIKYYDAGKLFQRASQYQKRISQPYASALLDKAKVTHSRTQLIITSDLSDFATPMKQKAEMGLYDKWISRMNYEFKTGPKYIRLDPTDVIQIDITDPVQLAFNPALEREVATVRITEVDRGAGGALQFRGVGYDSGVYSSLALSDSGFGSGGPPIVQPPPVPPPPVPVITTLLGSASDATVEIEAPTDGAFELEHFQTFTPAFAIIEMFGEGGNVWLDGEHGTLMDSTKLYLAASATGVKAKAFLFKTAPTSLTNLAPADGPSEFNVANPLHSAPGLCLPIMTSGGNIWNQTQIADPDFLYFTKSGDGVTGLAALWAALTGSATPSITCKRIPVAAQAAGGPFTLRHGVGSPIKNVFIHMNAPGFPKFWFQDGVSGAPDGYDDVNLYLVAPDVGVSGFAEVLY